MKICIINGPNLNLLGTREKSIYGDRNFEQFFEELISIYSQVELTYFQSNVEGEIINQLHAVGFEADGIILNAGGYTHTSVAIGDAVAGIQSPVVEVHISNIHAREVFRHTSLIAPKAAGMITGFGLSGYKMALDYLIKYHGK